MEHFLAGSDHGQDLDEMDRFEETELEDIVAVPGATQVVHALQKHPGAIVTSAWGTLRRRAFKAAGLPVPEVIVPADEIRNGKPDPEGFLRAAELLGIPPEECLVFEDTCPGIKAGVNAGMQIVALLSHGDFPPVESSSAHSRFP